MTPGAWAGVAAAIVGLMLVVVLAFKVLAKGHKRMSFKGRHCIVTGGSSGIGKEVAMQLAREGAHVTIVARNVPRLEAALRDVAACAADTAAQRFAWLSLELGTCPFGDVQAAFDAAQAERGPCAALFNVAGMAAPMAFDAAPVDSMEALLRTNLLAAMHATRAALPGMKARREGRVLFTASVAGLMGLYGYTTYAATKFGLRGFAEALSMEVHAYGIAVSVAFPPDTVTPGYEAENAVKDPVCARISADGAVFDAPSVAHGMVRGAARGAFRVTTGADAWLTGIAAAAFSPAATAGDAIVTVLLSGVLRLAALVYLHRWYSFAASALKAQDRARDKGKASSTGDKLS
ncbi:hypothetical protein JKP88DRAFT_259284 [Tribonema minus]|uniref:3-ketodihydrosphingosine reductase n=1 Tax=Tribonema minus TaxID=303371 RepID=A0A836C6V7_9STRA|nr:hypothetical protein JKP88DRAFT_259284 [Tribonema minus]